MKLCSYAQAVAEVAGNEHWDLDALLHFAGSYTETGYFVRSVHGAAWLEGVVAVLHIGNFTADALEAENLTYLVVVVHVGEGVVDPLLGLVIEEEGVNF